MLRHLLILLVLLFVGVKVLGYMTDHGMVGPAPAHSTESPADVTSPANTPYDQIENTSVIIPPDPHFPCEDPPYTTVCTPAQAQTLIDRNCAQSHADGDTCGVDIDSATGMRYAYNIQSPEHARQTEGQGQRMSQQVCDALAKDGAQCTVIAHD